jgi:hypothetical protein
MSSRNAILLCVFAIAVTGCGKDEKTIATPGGAVTVTKSGNTTSVEVSGKDGKITVASNEKGVALPDKFPADVPVMPGATVKMAAAVGENLSVHLGTAAAQADVAKYYEENLKAKGWSVDPAASVGELTIVAAKKGERRLGINIVKDGAGSVVQLMVPRDG